MPMRFSPPFTRLTNSWRELATDMLLAAGEVLHLDATESIFSTTCPSTWPPPPAWAAS